MQKNHCDILCHSVEKKCWILTRKPSHRVEVPLKSNYTEKGNSSTFEKFFREKNYIEFAPALNLTFSIKRWQIVIRFRLGSPLIKVKYHKPLLKKVDKVTMCICKVIMCNLPDLVLIRNKTPEPDLNPVWTRSNNPSARLRPDQARNFISI